MSRLAAALRFHLTAPARSPAALPSTGGVSASRRSPRIVRLSAGGGGAGTIAGLGGGGGPAHVPTDVGDGNDDDVVARQLREAAMKEKDPQLQEKLWQEYRDYKQGAK